MWARLDAASFLTEDEKRAAAGYSAKGESETALKYSPDQPRVPAGSSDGGQWTDGGGGGANFDDFNSRAEGQELIAQNSRGRGSVSLRAGGRTIEATPAQVIRLSNATNAANGALARVREIDPSWRPTPSVYESAEGAIAARQAEFREAQSRLVELLRDAIPGTNPSWGVNRLTKELHDKGFQLVGPARKPTGLIYINPSTGERVRIMQRPQRRYSTEPDQKHNNDYYYRYQPGKGKQEGGHITIPNKRGSDE